MHVKLIRLISLYINMLFSIDAITTKHMFMSSHPLILIPVKNAPRVRGHRSLFTPLEVATRGATQMLTARLIMAAITFLSMFAMLSMHYYLRWLLAATSERRESLIIRKLALSRRLPLLRQRHAHISHLLMPRATRRYHFSHKNDRHDISIVNAKDDESPKKSQIRRKHIPSAPF